MRHPLDPPDTRTDAELEQAYASEKRARDAARARWMAKRLSSDDEAVQICERAMAAIRDEQAERRADRRASRFAAE